MTTESSHRRVSIERVANGEFIATNARGGQVTMSGGGDASFSPVELLLAAIGGCTAADVDAITSRRAEPAQFQVDVDADKLKDETGNRLDDVTVTFRIRFPDGEGGDKARALLPDVVQMSHDRLCTVGRTVERGTPITPRIE